MIPPAYNLLGVYEPLIKKVKKIRNNNISSGNNNDFRTFSEYMRKEDNCLTASMEDYLEMIYRLSMDTGFTRIHELSNALNVQPPSATKMVQRLGDMNYLKYEKYGVILLQETGVKKGEWLLRRHNTIEALLKFLELPEKTILSETEKIEHTISEETIKCFQDYINFIKDNPEISKKFNTYKCNKHDNNNDCK